MTTDGSKRLTPREVGDGRPMGCWCHGGPVHTPPCNELARRQGEIDNLTAALAEARSRVETVETELAAKNIVFETTMASWERDRASLDTSAAEVRRLRELLRPYLGGSGTMSVVPGDVLRAALATPTTDRGGRP